MESFQSEVQLLQMFLELSNFGVFDDDHLTQLVRSFLQDAQLQINVFQLPLKFLRLLIALQRSKTTAGRGKMSFLQCHWYVSVYIAVCLFFFLNVYQLVSLCFPTSALASPAADCTQVFEDDR